MSELQERLQRAIGDTYRIERELGGGGMSYVFLAAEVALNRRVVIKVLSPELTSEVTSARFRREMETTALLQHPHILPVLTTGTKDGLLYYVSPFVEGESLRHRQQRDVTIPIDDAVRILSELLSALAYAHERGVVHRDIKPENVLLSNGLAVLADFGISSVLTGTVGGGAGGGGGGGGARLTEVGVSMGTPGYMSPEQAAGERELDGRSDLYSLAVVGYELLTGTPPFTGPTPLSVMTAHLTATPRPVHSLRPDAPGTLVAALDRALSKKPEDRFQNAIDFRNALGVSYSGGQRVAAARMARWGTVAAVLAFGAIAALFLRGRSGPTGVTKNLIAIAPFEAVGPDLGMWREGLVDLLAANLDGAGPLRTVPPSVIVRRWRAPRLDRESALALGEATGAEYTVYGSVVSSGRDSLRVQLNVLDTKGRSAIGQPIAYRDASDRLDRVSDSLTYAVLATLNSARNLGASKGSSLGSSSVAALKEFLIGEQFYRSGAWDSSAVHYRNAVAADSNFAPALRHLSNAIGWKLSPDLQIQQEGYRFALLAGTKNVRLAPRESLLVNADSLMAALFIGQLPAPTRARLTARLTTLLEDGTRRFPEDPEVWFKLGDVRLHFTGPLLPSRSNHVLTRQAFDRSIELDSAFAPAYIHHMGLVAEEQDTAALTRSIRGFLALNPRDVQGDAGRFVADVLAGRIHPADPTDSSWARLSPQTRINAIATLFPLLDSAETQLALLRKNTALVEANPAASPGARINAKIQLVAALGLRGHYREALPAVDATTNWILIEAALVGAIPMDSARRVFTRLLDENQFQAAAAGSLLWADAGDTASVKRVVSGLETATRGNPDANLPLPLFRGLMSIARRDTAAAIRELTLSDTMCIGWCTQARFLLARLLAHRQADSVAASLLDQDFPQPSGMRVLWMLQRAQVNERLRRTDVAIDSYTFVARAWQGGDPEVQGFVQEARQALQRLRSDAPARR